jgi:hypothetical protein
MDPATDTTQTAFASPNPPAVHKAFWRAVFG